MGGHVKLIIRKESGEIYSGITHTNPLGHKLMNRDFLEGKSIDEIIKANIAWERQDTTPCPLIAPVEYGIVLFDFKTKTLLDWQGYTSLNRSLVYNEFTELSMIMSFLDKQEVDDEVMDYIRSEKCNKSDIQNTMKLFENGSFIGYSQHNNEHPGQKIITECTDFKKVMTVGISNERTRFKYAEGDCSVQEFRNNLFGFKYESFSDVEIEGLFSMKKAIIKLGFDICEDSEEVWKYHEERFEC